MRSGTFRARQLFVFFIFILSFCLLLVRLIYIQGIRYPFYSKLADEQHMVSVELEPKRGAIFDRNMQVLAINLNADSVYANARDIADKKSTARLLAQTLNLSENVVLERISRDKSFVWIKRKISYDEAANIKKLKLKGVEIIKESKRFYPNRELACHILGTVDIDNVGLEGLELYYNRYLKGESGWLVSMRDARKKLLQSYQNELVPPKNGFSLVLTIDEVIQTIAERELQKMCEKYHAKGGSIIIIDPKTGDILALANMPRYDLNEPSKRPVEAIRNRAINDFFEPGSVFKIVAASALLEEKAVKLTDTFFCENGEYRIGKRILHDVHPYGTLTFQEVIEKSSNIGTVKAASLLGPAKLHKYMKAFGFYEKTGIDLPGEVVGINRPVSKWSGVSMYAIPMGQEVTVTAIQLALAISVIADNGYITQPRIVKEIIDEDGVTIKKFPPKIMRKVISPETAYRMRNVLMGVVTKGTGKKAKTEDYTTGGKTGTAQKVVGGTYSHDQFIGSFIGFAPVGRPVLAAAVCIDEPRLVYYGGDVAAPVFRNVIDESLKYMNTKGIRTGR